MDTVASNFANSGQAFADKAADKVQSGIRDAQHAAKNAGAAVSSKVEDLRADAGPTLKKAAARGQFIGKQGIDALSDAAQKARDMASDASDSIISYTKENPVKALMLAAASGALLFGLVKLAKARN